MGDFSLLRKRTLTWCHIFYLKVCRELNIKIVHNLENQLLHKLENLMVSKVVLLIWYYQIEIIFCLIHLIFEKLAFCMAPCTILIISQSCTQVRKCVIYNFNLGWTLKVHIFWELGGHSITTWTKFWAFLTTTYL